MADLHLFWEGPSSDRYLTGLSTLFHRIYPHLSQDRTFDLGQSFEFTVRNLLTDQPGVIELENQLYYEGALKDFRLRLPLRSGNQPIFPEVFFASEVLPLNETIAKPILENVKAMIESTLHLKLKSEIYEDWERKDYVLFLDKEIVLSENFEKTLLGIFFYMIYLQQRFQNDPNVCVIISDLLPLITRLKSLEAEIATLSEDQFKAKNPLYAGVYSKLVQEYREEKPHHFRFSLFENILQQVGPYLIAEEDRRTGELSVRMTKSFETLFNRCHNSHSRYTVAFVALKTTKSAHANILIIDNQERIIERFDPNGATAIGSNPEYEKVTESLDRLLDDFSKKMEYLYVSPEVFCPRIGVQAIEGAFSGEIGYCVSWSILYAEERLTTYQSRSWVSANLLSEIVRKYNLKGRSSNQTSENIERWIHERIANIFEQMDRLFKILSEALGLNVKYVGGKLIYLE